MRARTTPPGAGWARHLRETQSGEHGERDVRGKTPAIARTCIDAPSATAHGETEPRASLRALDVSQGVPARHRRAQRVSPSER